MQFLLLWTTSLAAVAAISIPPENQQMGAHHLTMSGHESPFSGTPVEYVDNSLLGGREVDPIVMPALPPPSAVSNASSASATDIKLQSSVRKETVDEAKVEKTAIKKGPSDEDKKKSQLPLKKTLNDIDMVGGKMNELHSEDNLHLELQNIIGDSFVEADHHRNRSSIKPRKGVPDPKPSVVGRKGAVYTNNTDMADPDLFTTQRTELSTATTASKFLSSSTTGIAGLKPFNDIPIPPLKDVTTEKSVVSFEPIPVFLGSSTTPSGAAVPKVVFQQQPAKKLVKHYKPLTAVDSVSNKAFNSTPIIMGVVFGVVVILAVAILAYKKLQDVWSRRHYDRMDFLIDGMYDL